MSPPPAPMNPPLQPTIPPPTFDPLTPSTSLYTPPSTSSSPSTSSPPPPLILLFTWNAAPTRPIQKYTSTYTTLFPNSRILLLRTSTSDIAFRTSAALAASLRPALDVVRAHTRAGGDVLLHLFSNGGGVKCVEFVKAWMHAYGGEEDGRGIEGMRVRCMLLDSSPGKGDWARSHKAMTASLPRSTALHRVVFAVLVHALILGIFIFNAVVRGGRHVMRDMCADLNDASLFPPTRGGGAGAGTGEEGKKKVPRVYLYSKADEMVGWDEVEEHAAEARERGWEVRLVRFEASGHVAHVREDEGRYWGEVRRAWERGV